VTAAAETVIPAEEGGFAPSPAGPAADDGGPVRLPPALPLPRSVQTLHFSVRQLQVVFRARRELGDPFRLRGMVRGEVTVVTSHPDHVRSLLTARPEDAPSLTGQSPLRPVLGPDSVLTSVGARHMRRRKVLGVRVGRAAAAACLPRRGRGPLRGDDRGGRPPRDRPLAGRRAPRAGPADAGSDARRDHGRHLRDRGPSRARQRRGRPAPGGAPHPGAVDHARGQGGRAREPRAQRAGRRAARCPGPPRRSYTRSSARAGRSAATSSAPTSSRSCSRPAPRTARRSATASCATSS
jgi:hypothetical protein